MLIRIVNIFLSFLLPVAIILINNAAVISYFDIYLVLKIVIIFSIFALIPYLFSFVRNSRYDLFVLIFISLTSLISLISYDIITFTYKQTIGIWIILLSITLVTLKYRSFKNSLLLSNFLGVFIISSFVIYFVNSTPLSNNNNYLKNKKEIFVQTSEDYILNKSENFFFIIFDGFPRISNLDKIGYDTSKLRNLFKKYNLYLFENTKSSYLDSQKSISSTMNLSLIEENIKLDKKNYYKFINDSKLLEIFRQNGYKINWFPNDLTMSKCPLDKDVNCFPGKHKIHIFNKEIVKFYFQMFLVQPYWIEKANMYYVNKIIKKDKILFHLDIVTEFVKNNKNINKQFIFAHIMSPHPPYILNSKCGLQKFGLKYVLHDEKSFLNQIDCINLQFERFFKEISEKMPNSNLFIHSDHGTTLINLDDMYGEENYQNFILVNKPLLCDYKNIKNKINFEILRSVLNCI